MSGFFDNVGSATWLLKLKPFMSTFGDLFPQDPVFNWPVVFFFNFFLYVYLLFSSSRNGLVHRDIYWGFSYGHLDQLKLILPEAIEIEKVLMFDEKTSCMTQDLHVTINVDAIDCNVKSKSDSKKMDVRKVFRARLMDFMKGHPEVYYQLNLLHSS